MKILVAEDDALLRQALVKGLSSQGWEIFQASDGEEGLALAEKMQPDIILTDVMMPKLDGLSMLKKIREGSEWGKNVPVLALTNLSEGKSVGAAMDLLVSGYLVKVDWKMEDIIEKVKNTLPKGQV